MNFPTVDALRESLANPTPNLSPEYVAKMLHKLPEATSVDRVAFILERVKGKRVLEFGASGPMHLAIQRCAQEYTGVDREERYEEIEHDTNGKVFTEIIGFDLDDVSIWTLPPESIVALVTSDVTDLDQTTFLDVIVCGEVLEHLGNPQWFLTRLKRQYAGVPVIITVPNAFTNVGRHHLSRGFENVNKDHVAWYSPKTLSVLLDRVGYAITEFHYYGGDGPTAEGLVVVAE